jgi:hypothetical protein
MGFFNGFSSRRKVDFKRSEKRDSKPDGTPQDPGFPKAEIVLRGLSARGNGRVRETC